MRTSASKLLWLAPLLATASCATHIGNFAFLSNRHHDGDAPVAYGGRVRGQDCGWMVLTHTLREPSLEQATENALNADPKALYLADVRARRTVWWLGVGRSCYQVEGTLVVETVAPPIVETAHAAP